MQYASQKARFSRCRRYRYSLQRQWHGGHGRVLFIGLNRSRQPAHPLYLPARLQPQPLPSSP